MMFNNWLNFIIKTSFTILPIRILNAIIRKIQATYKIDILFFKALL